MAARKHTLKVEQLTSAGGLFDKLVPRFYVSRLETIDLTFAGNFGYKDQLLYDSSMKKILFICVHNSVRSQMAEGLARHYGQDLVEAYSAGFYETGVNPLVTKVMGEIGIDVSGQRSKTLDEVKDVDFDYVISLCAEMEAACPALPGANQLHWPTVDPGKVKGTPTETLVAFRQVRDELKGGIVNFLARIEAE